MSKLDNEDILNSLRENRQLLLFCEAIGWIHMTGKARIGFLENKLSVENSSTKPEKNENKEKWYDDTIFCNGNMLNWVKDSLSKNYPVTSIPAIAELLDKYPKSGGVGLLGLLQASHAMSSGIEKNLCEATSEYLAQKYGKVFVSDAFGDFNQNLLGDEPPPLLTDEGWRKLLQKIETVFKTLKRISRCGQDLPDMLWAWRERAINKNGWLRKNVFKYAGRNEAAEQ